MNNLIFGILTTLACLIFWVNAFLQFRKGRPDFSILLIVLAGFLLRIYAGSDLFLHSWDERYHALVAKNMMEFPFRPMLYAVPKLPYDAANWTTNHIWIHKQPFTLWMIALSMKTFGVNEIALRLPSILLSTIGIFIVYKTATYFGNTRIGLIAAFLFSVNGLILELLAGRTPTDHPDIFFMCFILFSVYQAIRFCQTKKTIHNTACGVFAGIAILCKWLPAMIILPIWLLVVVDAKLFSKVKIVFHFMILLLIITVVFLPWQIYILRVFPAEAHLEYGYNFKHINEVLGEHSGTWLYYINQMRINYGELIYIPVIWFLIGFFRKKIPLKDGALFIWLIVPILFFSFVKTKMEAYTLFAAPAVFIITALFIDYLTEVFNKKRSILIPAAIIIFLFIIPLRYCIERIKPFTILERNPEWAKELRNMELITGEQMGVVFNAPRPVELMFYSDFTGYSELPDVKTIEDLIRKGNHVFINQNAPVPSNYYQVKGVKWIRLTN
ncbi:MAG: glycosyltransferase family 39 protein [Chitinophagales bacterium]